MASNKKIKKQPTKRTKIISSIAFFVAVIIIAALLGTNPESEQANKGDIPTQYSLTTTEGKIEQVILKKLSHTEIVGISINDNLGKNDGSKIALIKLIWHQTNGPELTRKMLRMYSATIANNFEGEKGINEVVIFWEVPYHMEGGNIAKFNYFRQNEEMYVGKEWLAPKIRG